MKTALILALSLALTACGGGGSDEPAAPVVAAPCVPLTQVRVQLFGDSTQEGYEGHTNTIATTAPVNVLQAALDAEFGRGATLVTVRAQGGTTARELITGTDGRNQPWPRSVNADLVVINHGINDMTHYGPEGFAQYKADLRTLARQSPAKVIFETPNIVKEWNVGVYAQAMREAAAEVGAPVADVYAFTAALPDWQVLVPDWAHPSTALYQRIGDRVLAPVVAAEVRGLLCK